MKVKLMLAIILSFLTVSMLTACGQSGALYLPTPEQKNAGNSPG